MAGRFIRSAVWLAWMVFPAALVVFPCGLVRADDTPAKEAAEKPAADSAAASKDAPAEEKPAAAGAALSSQQQAVLDRYGELEKKLLRMAELTAGTDPHRAALLRKAVAQSKQQGIEAQLAQLVELLGQDRLAPAMKSETAVEQDLAKLLQLLLSEDRTKRLQSEKERIQKYIQRVNQLIKQQKQLQGEAAGDGDMKQLAESQAKLAEKTQELVRDLAADPSSEKERKPGEAKSSDSQDSDGKKGDGTPSDKPNSGKSTKPADGDKKKPNDSGENKSDGGKPAEGESGDKSDEGTPAGDQSGEKMPKEKTPGQEKSGQEKSDGEKSGDDKPSDEKSGQPGGEKSAGGQGNPGGDNPNKKPSGQKNQGDGSPGQPSQGEEGKPEPGEAKPEEESPEQGDNSSTRRRVAQAEQRMREAEKKLADAQRQQAIEKQEEAKRELELAKAELEAILRQLREEEIGRTLAMLESRFRKMLEMQNQVNTGTKRLDKVPEADRDHDDEIEAGRLSRQEALIVDEANKALAVLHDEGSAVAFPEAVSDLRDDMEQVVVRLAQAKVDAMTQGVEDDIVVSLEEMIAAFHKAQKKVEAKAGGAGGESESPLVDTLAEIKMIKSMQTWVNGRTKRFTELSKTDQADTPELIAALRKLAEREERIHRAARDIVVGRNK